MSKDYAHKIRILLNESNQTVPYVFERFYTVLKKVTIELKDYDSDPKVFQQYALIYKTIKKYIKDEPYALVNSIPEKIHKQLKNLLNPFTNFIKQDTLSKKILDFFVEEDVDGKLNGFIEEAEKAKKQFISQGLRTKVFGTHQLANSFWINKFKLEYAVHFDVFWVTFIEFIQRIPFFEYFVSISSKRSIRRKVDPEKKYYITSSNVNSLFYKLSEPQFLEKLADQTAKGEKSHHFVSKDFLEMEFIQAKESQFQTDLKQGQEFEISGEDILVGGKKRICKYPPTVSFGSALDSDIKIKNKYISRKQFMIIEEEDSHSTKANTLAFSLVCLSSSNFTMITYERPFLLESGTIFKVGETSIQILKIYNVLKAVEEEKISETQKSNEDEDDQTLEHLPSKAREQISDEKELEYIVLIGKQKGEKGKLNKEKCLLQFDEKILNVSPKEGIFYLPAKTLIYVKTAFQVINGQLSNKIPLEESMRIVLEECSFFIK